MTPVLNAALYRQLLLLGLNGRIQETIWSYYLQTNNRFMPGDLRKQAFVFINTIEDAPIEDMAEWQAQRGPVNNSRYSMQSCILKTRISLSKQRTLLS